MVVGNKNPTAVNGYDRSVVSRDVAAAGAHVAGRFATHDKDTTGALLISPRAYSAFAAASSSLANVSIDRAAGVP